MWKSEFRQNYYRTSFSPTVPPFAARISRVIADGGTWRLKWERLKAGESNGKLPPRTRPGYSVPEPYRSHDWALVPAKPGLQGWILMNEWMINQPVLQKEETLRNRNTSQVNRRFYCQSLGGEIKCLVYYAENRWPKWSPIALCVLCQWHHRMLGVHSATLSKCLSTLPQQSFTSNPYQM